MTDLGPFGVWSQLRRISSKSDFEFNFAVVQPIHGLARRTVVCNFERSIAKSKSGSRISSEDVAVIVLGLGDRTAEGL